MRRCDSLFLGRSSTEQPGHESPRGSKHCLVSNITSGLRDEPRFQRSFHGLLRAAQSRILQVSVEIDEFWNLRTSSAGQNTEAWLQIARPGRRALQKQFS